MQEKRRQRESEFEQRKLENEKERLEAARTKESEREERIAALNAQQVAQKKELQRKIQQKVCETLLLLLKFISVIFSMVDVFKFS